MLLADVAGPWVGLIVVLGLLFAFVVFCAGSVLVAWAFLGLSFGWLLESVGRSGQKEGAAPGATFRPLDADKHG